MDYLQINGPSRLQGTVSIAGAKNAALPLIAAALLSDRSVAIENLPDVVDIQTMLKLLGKLGAEIVHDKHSATIDCSHIGQTRATYDIVKTMRASILVLGPLLSRFGTCEVSLPGGCAIGQRPIDLHLKALEQMGAQITIKKGYVVANAPAGLQGGEIIFDKITVTGSENIIMAAALAHGKTRLINAAMEPEVVQLCEVIRQAGIDIKGIGSSELIIEGSGGTPLQFQPIRVIPDRIEAGTYLCAAAITRSPLTIDHVRVDHLDALLSKLKQMGCHFESRGDTLKFKPPAMLRPIEISTSEFPGFPTDMQAQMMAVATQAQGTSIIEERLFENRFMHVGELQRMGAGIHLKGNTATIHGPIRLMGADVMATDLRASSALILAALAAEDETKIHRIYHLDRGYEAIDKKLAELGADIVRLKE